MQEEGTDLSTDFVRFHITNLGPLRKATIVLRPLSVFIGPNNAGKSYVATIIHALGTSFLSAEFPWRAVFSSDDYVVDKKKRLDAKLLEKIVQAVGSNLGDLGVVGGLVEDRTAKIVRWTLAGLERSISGEIVRSFSCRLSDIVRFGANKMRIVVENRYSDYEVTVSKTGEVSLRVRDIHLPIKRADSGIPYIPSINREVIAGWISHLLTASKPEQAARAIADVAVVLTTLGILYPLVGVTNSLYLPAARGGSVQTYRSLAAEYVLQLPFALSEPQSRPPTLSKTMALLFAKMINMPDERGPLAEIAEEYEARTTGGHIEIVQDSKHKLPRLEFRYAGHSMGLQRVSSSISELAPLYLYLKYYVTPKSMLTIEEPEAHLHPENQLIVAKLIARLVNEGVVLLVTTHSDYLLNQLSNCIGASRLTSEQKQALGILDSETLPSDKVAIYLFETVGDGEFTTRQLCIDWEGIPDDEFSKVYEQLYEQSVLIDTALSRPGDR